MCGLTIEHDGGSIVSLRGDRDDPWSRGFLCPKAAALPDIHTSEDRLRQPMRRLGDRWEPMAWDDALDWAARRIVEVQRQHGRHAVAAYVGNPSAHDHGSLIFGQMLLTALGTYSRYSATSLDQLPHSLAALWMYGHQLLIPVPDVDRTDFLLVLGANPMVSQGSIMSAPDMRGRLRALRERGGKLILIDPRRTETAKVADEHHPIRPGTDGFLLAAMARVILDEGWGSREAEHRGYIDGIDGLAAIVDPFTPQRVAPLTGIRESTIVDLARQLAHAPRAAVYGRMGVCTQRFGGLNAWLINVLNIITGRLDVPGGVMFTRPAADFIAATRRLGQLGHFGKGHTRVRGLPEFNGEYPAVALAEEIDTPGEGRVRALVTMAGNPVLSVPNGARLDRALGTLDFMVAVDLYRNETTRHADLILPPTSPLERSHYDLALQLLAVRNTTKFSVPLFEPAATARADWQIRLELATRIARARGGLEGITATVRHAVLSKVGPDGVLDLLLRTGPYGAWNPKRRPSVKGGLSLAALKAHPHGVDLGPLQPSLPERLATPDRHVKLLPEGFVADVARLVEALEEAERGGADEGDLLIIGRRQLRNNNSWMHNLARLTKGAPRCTLMMHPDDARARGIARDGRARVRSRVGAIDVDVEATEDVARGVVSLPHGFGHHRPGMKLSVDPQQVGVSMNDIMDDAGYDSLTGTAILNGMTVSVESVARSTTAELAAATEET